MYTATAIAHPNIAFIKYWGNRDDVLRIPANGSISMNLGALRTRTTVTFSTDIAEDSLSLNGRRIRGAALQRVSALLDKVREMADLLMAASVESSNNFPTGAGIASSASAFAALALASSAAAGLHLDEAALSRLARTGSGSACRSVPDGFVEWEAGTGDADSYAHSLAPAEHWDLHDCIAIVNAGHKPTGSSRGHKSASSSPLQTARVADAPRRLSLCRTAILERDFSRLAEVAEQDSNLMHAVMMTSSPPLFYWEPVTLAIIRAVQDWRKAGTPVFYTVDAGPNVHVLCPARKVASVQKRLARIEGVQSVLCSPVGGPARLVQSGGVV